MYTRDYSWAAGGFYPTKVSQAEEMIRNYMGDPSTSLEGVERVYGGIAPHAGWVYSGPTAGKVFRALSEHSKPTLAICFAAVHVHGVRNAAIIGEGEWKTPFGGIPIDSNVAGNLIDTLGNLATESNRPHEEEHSLEVILPFLKKSFPDISIVPIMMPPDTSASERGTVIGDLLKDRDDVIAIGSTDMTHYGARFGFRPAGYGREAVKWVKEVNDRRLIDLIESMKAELVVPEVARNHNACGAGAIAATVAMCKAMGAARGITVDYTTSYDVMPQDADTFVGYAGIVFA